MKSILICVIGSFLFSCGNSNELTPLNKMQIISEVTETLTAYHEAIGLKGLTAEFAFLDSSADFFWVPPGYSNPIAYDSVVKVLNQNAPLFSSVENSFDTLRIIPQSYKLATYTGKVFSRMTDTSGHTNKILLIETGTMVKRENGWKLLNGQTAIINQN